MASSPGFDDLRAGDFVKVRVGNERLWFAVVQPKDNAVLCNLASAPSQAVFAGLVTIDRDWIVETRRSTKPDLRVVV